MTRSRQSARRALSGMVMMLMAVAVGAAEPAVHTGAGKKATAAKPAKRKALNQIYPIAVTLSGDPCDHAVSSSKVVLDATYHEELGWWISNRCNIDEKVLLCVYKENVLVSSPFKPCTNSFTQGLDIGKDLPVRSGQQELLACEADIVGRYIIVVLTGAETKDGCDHEIQTRWMHRLDVEIIR